MNKINYIIVVILALLAGLAGAWLRPSSNSAGAKESAYERVMRTQMIRCGYMVWPPIFMKDPNTGELSGITHDYLEALGQALHLKIIWAEEMGGESFTTALNTGRVDGMCADVWPTSSRAREVDFARPTYYTPIYAYVRTDDLRFDNDLGAINDPSVTIVTMDGEMSALITASDYPRSKTVQLPQLANSSDLLNNIVTKKADVTFTDPMTAADYDSANPGKIRRVMTKTPVRIFGSTIAVGRGQDEFRRMLDAATEELLSSGAIEKILAKYEKYPGTLLRVAPPYETGAIVNSPPR